MAEVLEPSVPPIPGQPPSSKEDPLVAARAKFQELLEKQKSEVDLSKPIAGKDERTTPSGSKPKKPAPEPEEEAEEPEKAAAPPKRSSESEKLRAKLLLAGNPKKAIESLSDEEVGEWWKKQEERERSAALAIQRASELEKLVPKETAKPAEPQAGVPTDGFDLDEIKAQLSDQFGEEEAGVLTKVLSSVLDPLQKENREIKAILERARQTGIDEIVKRNRARLSEKMPAFKEDGPAWQFFNETVKARLDKDPSKYSSAEEVFDDVFQGLYGAMLAAKTDPPEDDKAKEKARIAASAHSQPASSKRQRVSTPLDAHRAAFEHLVKNADDTEGARKAYGRFLVQ